MGLRVYCATLNAKVPRATVLELTCDRCNKGGFFNRKPFTQKFTGSYTKAKEASTKAGWLETYRRGEREFIGPCCKDKKARAS